MADTKDVNNQPAKSDKVVVYASSSRLTEAAAAFTGYRPFPPIMNLHANYSGVLQAMTTHKLCGATPDDMLYLVEVHFGLTPRGPLHFGRGFYLRNGTSLKDPILAATGEVFRLPVLVSLFDPRTSVLLPPLDWDKNPRDKVQKIMSAISTKEHGVIFRFTVETGDKKLRREKFEWRKLKDKEEATGTEKGSQYRLYSSASRPTGSSSGQASSSSAPPPVVPELDEEGEEVLAELRFTRLFSLTHLFTLELKGAGQTGELGDRWALMVVMTSLAIYFLRQNGKTHKATVKAAEKFL